MWCFRFFTKDLSVPLVVLNTRMHKFYIFYVCNVLGQIFYTIEYLVIHCECQFFIFHWKKLQSNENLHIYLIFLVSERAGHVIFHIMGAYDEVGVGGGGGVKDVLNAGELTLPRCGLFFSGGSWCDVHYATLLYDLKTVSRF